MTRELRRWRDVLELFAEAAARAMPQAPNEERRRKRERDAARWFKRDARRLHVVPAAPAPASPVKRLTPAPGSIQERRWLKRQAARAARVSA